MPTLLQTSYRPYSDHIPIPTMATAASNISHSCKVVLASEIAKHLLADVTAGLSPLNRAPRLHGFLANHDPAAKMYADWTAKTCEEK